MGEYGTLVKLCLARLGFDEALNFLLGLLVEAVHVVL